MKTSNFSYTIAPQTGYAFKLQKGQVLRIIDPEGGQVADFLCFNQENPQEFLSTGATIDNNRALYIKKGDHLYSNLHRPLLKLQEDTAGAHDLLHPACNLAMYRAQYNITGSHASCEANFKEVLAPYGLGQDFLPTPFNVFMNTKVYAGGRIEVQAPLSKPGDYIELKALLDLTCALTACAVAQSSCNAGKCGPIKMEILS